MLMKSKDGEFYFFFFHARGTHLGGMNGNVQSDLATLKFQNGYQLGYFHSIVIRLKQEINLSGETVSPTRHLLQYTKVSSKSYKLKAYIALKMKDIITFPGNNGKWSIYTEGNIHGFYCYIEIIIAPTNLTTSGQVSHHFFFIFHQK